jgi:endosialidase-like protein
LNNNGSYNTAVGENALVGNVAGDQNMAFGQGALAGNVEGDDNVAIGFQALHDNSGEFPDVNVAIGTGALKRNRDGSGNVAVGFQALINNNGVSNTALGTNAGSNLTTGFFNTFVGLEAGVHISTANNVIAIGTSGGNTSDTCWIGNIYGKTTVSATTLPVIVSNTGQLGTTASSVRFKHDIKPMDKTSDAILALKPVTFHYKSDSTNTPQFGLIAEEVAAVNPDLVVRDENGEIYTVRYDAVNAMLLNEFLKEHEKVQKLEAALAAVNERLKAQDAKIDKVNAKVELSKAAPQTVLNNQ